MKKITHRKGSLRKHETGITTQVLASIDYTFKHVTDTTGHSGMARAPSWVERHESSLACVQLEARRDDSEAPEGGEARGRLQMCH